MRKWLIPLALLLALGGLTHAQQAAPQTPQPLTIPNAGAMPAAPATSDAAALGAGLPTPPTMPTDQIIDGACGPKPPVDLRDFHAGPCYKCWFSGDYLMWWTKAGPLPVALITTSPPASLGVLGAPGTSVILGNSGFRYGTISGARFEGGSWLNECHTIGIEMGIFGLSQRSTNFTVNSDATGSPLLARPFFNALTSVPSAAIITFPGAFRGGIAVDSTSLFWGDDVNFIRNIYASPTLQANLLAGFRNLNLEESIEVTSSSVIVTPPVPGTATGLLFPTGPGTFTSASALTLVDRFGTVNHFYGGQLGASAQYWMGRFVITSLVKVALGVNHESVNVLGKTSAFFPTGGGATVSGGLLALPGANFGPGVNSTTNFFAVSPEVRLGLGYQLTRNLRAQIGYTMIYLNGVARPGDQISPIINPRFVPTSPAFGSVTGPVAPTLSIRQTDFWAQGLNFGLTLTY